MLDYLSYLAERKYALYRTLYHSQPAAYSIEQCYDRMVNMAKYEEIVQTIENLPIEHQNVVDDEFNLLIGS